MNAGYVKVLHGFKAMRNGFDHGFKVSIRQVYANIKAQDGENMSRSIGIKDCSESKCRISICQIHLFRMQGWYSHQELLVKDPVEVSCPHLGQQILGTGALVSLRKDLSACFKE